MNFRIGQEVRCLGGLISLTKSIMVPIEGGVYTVKNRSLHNHVTYIELEGMWGSWPSSCFECAEVMEDVDKAVNDIPRKSSIHNDLNDFTGMGSTFGVTVQVDNPEYDKELKAKWEQSVKDEEYEKSRIYYDELIERKVLIETD